jgi:hypothetical protein
MTERTDHAAEALRNINGLHDYQSEEGISDASMLTVAIEAQAHATLALVEQQRIANRIALAVAIREDTVLGGSATDLSDWLHEGNGVVGYFSAAEQEDLGVA